MTDCELCVVDKAIFENDLAYARYDGNSLSRGHVLVVPTRHVPRGGIRRVLKK